MKLFCDPASTTSRPLLLFKAEQDLQLDVIHVDLAVGDHLTEAFSALNPNRSVPVLVENDGFVLTECSAILKYLADAVGSVTYPAEPRARALVNAAMDWFNTGFYRDAGYGLVYAMLLPQYRIDDPQARAVAQHRARLAADRWMEVLDRSMIGDRAFVCCETITIADYLGSAYVTLLDAVGYDFAPFPNVGRWLATMRRLPSWGEANAAFHGMLSALRPALAETG